MICLQLTSLSSQISYQPQSMKCVYSELQSCQKGKSQTFTARRRAIWTEQYHDSLCYSLRMRWYYWGTISAFQNCSTRCARQIASRTQRWSSSTTAYGTVCPPSWMLSCLMINGVRRRCRWETGTWNSLCSHAGTISLLRLRLRARRISRTVFFLHIYPLSQTHLSRCHSVLDISCLSPLFASALLHMHNVTGTYSLYCL